MKMRDADWKSLLVWEWVGSFTGFVAAMAAYSSGDGNEGFVYLIYLGLLAGVILGSNIPLMPELLLTRSP